MTAAGPSGAIGWIYLSIGSCRDERSRDERSGFGPRSRGRTQGDSLGLSLGAGIRSRVACSV
jgi:hypothetical protein